MFSLFKRQRTVSTVHGEVTPEIAVAMVHAQTRALFTPSCLSAAVRYIDPPKASLEELHAALHDCGFYWATAYPENENELVEWIEAACITELKSRLRGTLLEGTINQLPRYAHELRD